MNSMHGQSKLMKLALKFAEIFHSSHVVESDPVVIACDPYSGVSEEDRGHPVEITTQSVRYQRWNRDTLTYDVLRDEIKKFDKDGNLVSYEIFDHERGGVGDLSCINNARSPYIRCGIHPLGPCHGCSDYQPFNRPGRHDGD